MRLSASVLGVLVSCSAVCAQSGPVSIWDGVDDPAGPLIERLKRDLERIENGETTTLAPEPMGGGVMFLLPTDPPQLLGLVDDGVWTMPVLPLGEGTAEMNTGAVSRLDARELWDLWDLPAPEPAALHLHRLDFVGDRTGSAARFRAERARLGDKAFVEQLTSWASSDHQRLYWSGAFLTSRSYLAGDESLPFVAMALWSEGASALDTGRWEDEMSAVSMRVLLAIEAERLGLHATAREHKAWVEERFEDDERMLGSFPAIAPRDRALYEGIGVTPTAPSGMRGIGVPE
ncbi:MAG: hypothetical protein AAGH64_12260 [Planctomycetota bacterium]